MEVRPVDADVFLAAGCGEVGDDVGDDVEDVDNGHAKVEEDDPAACLLWLASLSLLHVFQRRARTLCRRCSLANIAQLYHRI